MIPLEIPMYESDDEAYHEYIRKRDQYWNRLRKVNAYWSQNCQSSNNNFFHWLETEYGFRPRRDSLGNILYSYDIIDESLYTLFLLKFGQ